jgi:tetratricopeptide (TPR) repeat protein
MNRRLEVLRNVGLWQKLALALALLIVGLSIAIYSTGNKTESPTRKAITPKASSSTTSTPATTTVTTEPEWQTDYELGLKYMREGKYSLAIDFFEDALKLKPDFPEAKQKLAEAKKLYAEQQKQMEEERRKKQREEIKTYYDNIMKIFKPSDDAMETVKRAAKDVASGSENIYFLYQKVKDAEESHKQAYDELYKITPPKRFADSHRKLESVLLLREAATENLAKYIDTNSFEHLREFEEQMKNADATLLLALSPIVEEMTKLGIDVSK